MALMPVPVTDWLHLNTSQQKCHNWSQSVEIHLSPFFIFKCSSLGSTSVFSKVCLGNLALQFPCLLIQLFALLFAFSHQLELKCDLVTFDLRIKSSTVFLKFAPATVFSQDSHCYSHSLWFWRSISKVWVDLLYSLASYFHQLLFDFIIVPVINSPTWHTFQILTILSGNQNLGHNPISNLLWDNEFKIQEACVMQSQSPCCST